MTASFAARRQTLGHTIADKPAVVSVSTADFCPAAGTDQLLLRCSACPVPSNYSTLQSVTPNLHFGPSSLQLWPVGPQGTGRGSLVAALQFWGPHVSFKHSRGSLQRLPTFWTASQNIGYPKDFQPNGNDNRPLKLMLSAGLAGGISRTVTAPLDRIKFLMIMGNPGLKEKYTVRQAVRAMRAEGTYKAMFRGNGTNVVKNVPENAIKLTVNDRMQTLLISGRDHPITLGERLLIGSMAGGLSQVAIYPLEVIQTRLAATHGVYKGMLDCALKIWTFEGPSGFLRGLAPTLLGILPYAGIDIAAFEIAKEGLVDMYGGAPSGAALLGAGLVSSTIAQIIAYPLGFVRTRLQMDGRGGQARQYRGMWDCFRKVVQLEGYRGLYKGFGMNLAKVAPAASISWFVFEESKLYLHCPDVCHHK